MMQFSYELRYLCFQIKHFKKAGKLKSIDKLICPYIINGHLLQCKLIAQIILEKVQNLCKYGDDLFNLFLVCVCVSRVTAHIDYDSGSQLDRQHCNLFKPCSKKCFCSL